MWGPGSPLGKGLKPAKTYTNFVRKGVTRPPPGTLGVGRRALWADWITRSFGSELEKLL